MPGNNTGTDTNPVGPQADLTISKSSSPNPYVPGTPLTYTVVVSNAGPCDVINARVQDALPAAAGGLRLDLHAERAGASCGTPAGTRRHRCAGDAAGGTSATFTVSGTVPAGTTGALINTATVTPPLGVTDPVPGNNDRDRHQPGGAAGGPDDQQGEQPATRTCRGRR